MSRSSPQAPARVFLSYSRRDEGSALELAEMLRAADMTVWMDQSPSDGIVGGENYGEAIVEALEGSDVMVLLLSSGSVDSRNVAQEVRVAWERDLPILPVRLDPTLKIPKQLAYWLEGVQYIDIDDPTFESRLRAAIRRRTSWSAPPSRSTSRRVALVAIAALAVGGTAVAARWLYQRDCEARQAVHRTLFGPFEKVRTRAAAVADHWEHLVQAGFGDNEAAGFVIKAHTEYNEDWIKLQDAITAHEASRGSDWAASSLAVSFDSVTERLDSVHQSLRDYNPLVVELQGLGDDLDGDDANALKQKILSHVSTSRRHIDAYGEAVDRYRRRITSQC